MQLARYKPISAQGEISGKGQPDSIEFTRRDLNARDGRVAGTIYGGGSDKHNLSIMPGELLVGYRNRAAQGNFDVGFTSFSGFEWGGSKYASDEAIYRDIEFKGVVKGPYEMGGTEMALDHGFPFLKAGSYSIVNNAHQRVDIGPNTVVGWQLPANNRDNPRRSEQVYTLDNGSNPVYTRNQGGHTPYTKALAEVVPFDPSDFSTQLTGVAAALNSYRVKRARMSEFDLRSTHRHINSKFSALELEAGAWAFGLAGILDAAGVDLTGLGLNLDDADPVLSDAYVARVLSLFGNNWNQGVGYGTGLSANRKFLQANALELICRGVTGAWYSKASRIIGKTMNGAKPDHQLNIMCNIAKVSF